MRGPPDLNLATPEPSFFQPFRVGVADVFQIIALLHIPSVLELQGLFKDFSGFSALYHKILKSDILISGFYGIESRIRVSTNYAICPDPEVAKQSQTITLPPAYLNVTIMFFL